MYFPISMICFNLMMGTIFLLLSSNNWLMIWISFELNTLFFIPFLKNKFYNFFSEAMMKYFILQSICSVVFILMWMIFNNFSMMLILLFMKMGLPPFHYWILDLMKFSSWKIFFLLMTVQKMGLLVFLSYFNFYKNIILLFISLMMIMSIFMIYLQNNLFFMIMFSSFIHNGWLVSSMFFSKKLFFMYFIFYMFYMYIVCVLFNNYNNFLLSQNLISFNMWIIWILMGLPPFSIFLMKWSISIFLMKWSISIFLMFILMTFMMLYIYFKLIYMTFLMKHMFFYKIILMKNYFNKMIIMEIVMFGLIFL